MSKRTYEIFYDVFEFDEDEETIDIDLMSDFLPEGGLEPDFPEEPGFIGGINPPRETEHDRRSEAARRGWETRRANEAARIEAGRKAAITRTYNQLPERRGYSKISGYYRGDQFIRPHYRKK